MKVTTPLRSADIKITDAQGKITYVNDKFSELSQYSREELLGKDHRILNSGYHDKEFFADLWGTISSGKVWEGEICNRSKNGDLYWVHTFIVPFLDLDGHPRRYVAIRNDITKRKLADEALARSELKFRKIYESGLFGMLFWGHDGKINDANDAFLKMLGYTRKDQEEGRINWREITPPEFQHLDDKAIFDLSTTGVCEPFDKEYIRKDGSRMPVMIGGATFPDISGVGGVGGIAFVLDITARRQAELEKAKLLASEQAALQSSMMKSEFLANMSHEIRTPLNAIVGMADLISATQLTEEQNEYSTVIKNSVAVLCGLIGDILDFSKIESGKLDLEKIEFDLGDTVFQVGRELQCMAKSKGIRLVIEVPAEIPKVLMGDPIRVRQIVTNLITNGIKYTNDGSVTLRMNIEDDLDDELRLKVDVEDTGIGIEPAVIPKLFEPFIQSDSSTTRKYGGTGLGLSICKRLLELMGGQIGVESVPGRGSKFWFRLALAKARIDEKRKARPKADDPRSRRGSSHQILVVEDISVNQRVLTLLLSKLGLSADVVSNGIEAVSAVQAKKYDLVLMDCHMPEMDGYTATRVIRKQDRELKRKGVPIIAVTASAMIGDEEKCLAAGMNDYLSKPLTIEALNSCLEKWLPCEDTSGGLDQCASIDWDIMKSIRQLGEGEQSDVLKDLLDLFVKNVPVRLDSIKKGLENGDIASISSEAHGLRSSSCYLGAVRMGSLCEKMEALAHEESLDEMHSICGEIELEYWRVLDLMRQGPVPC